MRKLAIISGQIEEMGRTFSIWCKHEGFVKSRDLARDVTMLAGWPDGTNCMVCEIQSTEELFDADFEETKSEQALIGNHDYGYEDADLTKMKPRPINQNPGESWVFVLGDRLYLN